MRVICGYQVLGDMICIKEDETNVIYLIYVMYVSDNSLKKVSAEFFS